MSSKFKLTPAQQKAVDLRGHTMLVSAAAGSGKTAVLTQRIIKLLTDKDDPVDVSELLVVTFTKAAAAELKERISKAVYKALKEDPTNKHLSNQLLKLGKAKICTIHSFCADLVKSNFQRIGLPANMRISEPTEAILLQNSVANELIDDFYAGNHSDVIDDFVSFTENFLSANKDDAMPLILSKIYNTLRAYPRGIDILSDCAKELNIEDNTDIFSTKWGEKIKAHIKRTFVDLLSQYNAACDYFASDEVFAKGYLPMFEEDRRVVFDIVSNVDNASYADFSKLFFNKNKLKLGSVKKILQNELSDRYKKLRDILWKSGSDGTVKIGEKYFNFSEQTVRVHFKKTAEVCENLYKFLKLFDAKFRSEKRSKGLLDYSDLENYALELLYTNRDCNQITELADTVKNRFKYIFIDEYQDVNELQDKIFTAVSTPTNRFMVGDIKQSIYGFRGSEPTLFSNYRTSFPECSPDKDYCPESDGVTLYLSNNFRSDSSVIDFSNDVFEVLFNNNSGRAPYTEGDKLVCSRIYEENEKDFDVRICLIDDANKEGVINEARFVADEIEKLIKSGTEPSDIALLFRDKNKTVFFEEELKKRKIASYNEINHGFFENDAILLMLCLLNAVDNPGRDIYLAGLLKSPLFGFSMTDVTKIRVFEKNGTLYSALLKYTQETQNNKCLYFLEKLEKWRKEAVGCPVDKFIRYIYNETHIVELLSGKKSKDKDVERQANLLLLYQYASNFENGSFKGLYNFILYLNDLMDKKVELPNARLSSEGKGVVNIMTVHKSKGLEFNTVFICGTSTKFNRQDERDYCILHKDLGFTIKLRDTSSFGRINTFARSANVIALREDSLDDEIRVLYVALTRAKKRLIITSCLDNPKALVENIKADESIVSQNALLNTNKMIELLLFGYLKSGNQKDLIEYIEPSVKEVQTEDSHENTQFNEPDYDESVINNLEKLLEERLSFRYPFEELTELPSKMAVSALYPSVLDEYAMNVDLSRPSMYLKPKFLLPEKNRATGAEKGTATHVFMQFCDFSNVESKGVQSEIDRMLEKGFIDKRNADLVNSDKVKMFFKSRLYASLKEAKSIWREKRFNIKLPAYMFTQNAETQDRLAEESVLVQGVIDLLFVDKDDNVILADYKTDWFSESDIASGKAEAILVERHRDQLTYYAEACKRIMGRSVDKIIIYSFALNKEIEIK